MTDTPSQPEADRDRIDSRTQHTVVRERYSAIAEDRRKTGTGCCSDATVDDAYVGALGYDASDRQSVPRKANMGLGCGNPIAIDTLEPGETVLDLGSGGGFDCFLAASEVGPAGSVIGVDMTPEMIELARENAATNDYSTVEFRLGEIEHLPVADESVDVIISNCVINLSPDKERVFEEAARVLRPGGRLAISDVVATADLPDEIRDDPDKLAGCVAGAATIDDYRTMLDATGFEEISIEPKDDSDEFIREWSEEYSLEDYLASAMIEAHKPD